MTRNPHIECLKLMFGKERKQWEGAKDDRGIFCVIYNEYRQNSYKADGRPDCGANGQHNTACNIEKWFADGGLEKIKPLPTKRALIRTYNYGNYYGKRFIVDNVEAIAE